MANDGTSGSELWKSDGTKAGTVRVKDIRPGSDSSTPGDLHAIGNTLFFSAQSNEGGRELWKSDGTETGTVQVKDIQSGTASSSPTWLTVMGNKLYFSASDNSNDYELWSSDGTENGTRKVKEINPTTSGSQPYYLVPVGNTLFFVANDGSTGTELWKSDGTEAGTTLVKDIVEGSGSTQFDLLKASETGALYFSANDGVHGSELWKSDGSSVGTTLVKDLLPGANNGLSLNASYYRLRLVTVGNLVFFSGYDGTNDGLWRSDGSEAGTYRLPIEEIGTKSALERFSEIVTVGDMTYFTADDEIHGVELWRSDGTESGTKRITDSDRIFTLIPGNEKLFFLAANGGTSPELWRIDGKAADPVLITTMPQGTNLFFKVILNDTLYFTTYSSSVPQSFQLWKANNDSSEITLVKDLCSGNCTYSPMLRIINDRLVFLTIESDTGALLLWQSDGTAPGTTILKDFGIPPEYDDVFGIHQVGDTLLFLGYDVDHGVAIWKTDGTVAGTVIVKDVLPEDERRFSTYFISESHMYAVDNHALFRVDDRNGHISLWITDGSESGTTKLFDFDSDTHLIGNAFKLTTNYYFLATQQDTFGNWNLKLWKTDGQTTEILAEPPYGLSALVKVGQALFFRGYDEEHGVELWTSDGTVAGTRLAYDLFPGTRSSLPYLLTSTNNRLYFSAFTPEYGNELWMLGVPPQALQLSSPGSGAPGSRFVFTGSGFAPNEELPVYLTQAVSSASITADSLGTVLTDASGAFTVTLITDSAMIPGNYTLEVGDTVKVSAAFSLDSNAPLRQPASAGTVFATTQNVYLPLVNR